MIRELFNNVDIRRVISSAQVADDTAEVGQILDLANTSGCLFAINIGTLADANATFAVLIEDGNDSGLSDNNAVSDGFLIGTEALAGFQFDDDDETRKIAYVGPKRYVRMTITPSGNSGAADFGVVAIMSHLRKGPDSSQT